MSANTSQIMGQHRTTKRKLVPASAAKRDLDSTGNKIPVTDTG